MKVVGKVVKDSEEFTICDKCPCASSGDYGFDCRLKFSLIDGMLKERGYAWFSRNCKLEVIKYSGKSFSPEHVIDSEVEEVREYSETEKEEIGL